MATGVKHPSLILPILVLFLLLITFTEDYQTTVSTFSGGTVIWIFQDNETVTGNITYKMIDQGWTISVKGTITGSVTDVLTAQSTDATVKYQGKLYPVTTIMYAVKKNGVWVGTKTVSVAGKTKEFPMNLRSIA